MKPSRYATPEQRFQIHTNKNGPLPDKFYGLSNCWTWKGSFSRGRTGGYGYFKIGGKRVKAHRFSWEIHNGIKPGELYVLHKCDNRSCVNPDHLFLGTHLDNVSDMNKKGRNHQSVKQFCPKGHPYNEINTYRGRQNNGGINRLCRTCRRS